MEAMQKVRAIWPGMTDACAEDLRRGSGDMMNDTARCFKMTKPLRWRGLWLDVFEGQRFCPAPARKCEDDGRRGHIWIRFPPDEKPTGKIATGRTFAIEFVGRRTLFPGAYGHMGIAEHEVLVDRVISIKPFLQ
jgi:hypothetical protein